MKYWLNKETDLFIFYLFVKDSLINAPILNRLFKEMYYLDTSLYENELDTPDRDGPKKKQ